MTKLIKKMIQPLYGRLKAMIILYLVKNYTQIKNNSLIENRFKNAVFRTRKSKDTFECADRNINKSLRKLMNELKIPSEKRDALLLLADGNEVLWCEEIGVSKTLYDLNICEENLLKCQ